MTAHELAKLLLAGPDLQVYHFDPSFADSCDDERNYTLGEPRIEVVDPRVGLTSDEIADSIAGGCTLEKFITISGDQPDGYDRPERADLAEHMVRQLSAVLITAGAPEFANAEHAHSWATATASQAADLARVKAELEEANERRDAAERAVDRWRIEVSRTDMLQREIDDIGQRIGCNHVEGLAGCVKETIDKLETELAVLRRDKERLREALDRLLAYSAATSAGIHNSPEEEHARAILAELNAAMAKEGGEAAQLDPNKEAVELVAELTGKRIRRLTRDRMLYGMMLEEELRLRRVAKEGGAK